MPDTVFPQGLHEQKIAFFRLVRPSETEEAFDAIHNLMIVPEGRKNEGQFRLLTDKVIFSLFLFSFSFMIFSPRYICGRMVSYETWLVPKAFRPSFCFAFFCSGFLRQPYEFFASFFGQHDERQRSFPFFERRDFERRRFQRCLKRPRLFLFNPSAFFFFGDRRWLLERHRRFGEHDRQFLPSRSSVRHDRQRQRHRIEFI